MEDTKEEGPVSYFPPSPFTGTMAEKKRITDWHAQEEQKRRDDSKNEMRRRIKMSMYLFLVVLILWCSSALDGMGREVTIVASAETDSVSAAAGAATNSMPVVRVESENLVADAANMRMRRRPCSDATVSRTLSVVSVVKTVPLPRDQSMRSASGCAAIIPTPLSNSTSFVLPKLRGGLEQERRCATRTGASSFDLLGSSSELKAYQVGGTTYRLR
jgi:hypothetical protein